MLLITKKGLRVFDIKDFLSVGIKIHYLFFETTELSIITRVAGISKGEARRQIKAGSVWLGNEKVTNPEEIISKGNVAMTIFIGKEFKGIIL